MAGKDPRRRGWGGGLSRNLGHFSNLELLAGGGVWGRVRLGWVVLAVGFTLAPQPGSAGRTYMKLAIVIFFLLRFILWSFASAFRMVKQEVERGLGWAQLSEL